MTSMPLANSLTRFLMPEAADLVAASLAHIFEGCLERFAARPANFVTSAATSLGAPAQQLVAARDAAAAELCNTPRTTRQITLRPVGRKGILWIERLARGEVSSCGAIIVALEEVFLETK